VIDAPGHAAVQRLIEQVTATEVLPRFGRLGAGDVREKAPGDIVTVADRAAEAALAAGLTRIVPGSVVVGEESVSTDPARLDALASDAPVWVVDPIDGTEAYATGSPRFTTLVALAHRGRLLASWTHVPVLGRTATAVAGGGAFVDGRPLRVVPAGPDLRDLDVVAPQPRWWDITTREQMSRLGRSGIALSFFDTSGLEYLRLADGRRAAMIVTWEHAWDHAAGLLLYSEAGGSAGCADGRPFDLRGGNALPLVLAPDRDLVARIHQCLR
jgi:fructose-1,6-bisphosphatase/inositol monophosphatase family enzyme